MRLVLLGFFWAVAGLSGAFAQSCTNPVCLENQLTGTPRSQWDLNGPGSTSIAGFTTDISVNHGSTVNFKVKTSTSNWKIDIYRLGYYQGNGARLVATINVPNAQSQPAPLQDTTTGLYDAGNWSVSASWLVPATAVSGVYIAKLTDLNNTNNQNHIPFIVRADESHSDIVFETSDATWQAYNGWFGNNLYGGNGPGVDPAAPGRAFKVSYNRPFGTRDGIGMFASTISFLFGGEYPAIYWLEQNGYDVSYIAEVDSARSPSLLLNHKLFTSTGHDEYWSGDQRTAVEAARNAGVHLAFMSGNEIFWKTRWESSIDTSKTPYRTLVCYKETHHDAPLDPKDPPTWTGSWRDPRFSPPADGGKPENALGGTIYAVNAFQYDSIEVPYEMSQLRLWRNTPNVAATPPGGRTTLTQNILGVEWDATSDNGFAPPGLIYLSSTTRDVSPELLRNYGSIYGAGTATHNLTLYKYQPSGAIVFGTGTINWAWGLSNVHDDVPTPTDPDIQQAMVNVLADMGIQPQTLQPGLVHATKSSDATPPTSSISLPASGANLQTGQEVLISGVASDIGGKVAGVEVSVDGGTTWHRVTGTTHWNYTWIPASPGNFTILSRATDDSLNMETPSDAISVTVMASGTSLFSGVGVPDSQTTDDPNSAELGVKFTSSASGYIAGIRFYKNSINVGPHTGELWTSGGTLLATASFTSETASGWQQVNFLNPVAITAGTTYVASYHTTGFYSAANNYFVNATTSGPLTAPSAATSGGNGVFAYSSNVAFPSTGSSSGSNYWVDVVFAASTANLPPECTNASGFSTSENTPLAIQASAILANCSDPNGYTLTVSSVSNPTNGSVSISGSTVTFTPASNYAGSASFDFMVSNGHGGTAFATASLTVNSAGTGSGSNLFTQNDTPAIVTVSDASSAELGVKFFSQAAGYITGVQFYKGPQNTGTHTAHLWNLAGNLLASATFTNETASGWQQATFANPVAIAANTTYVASYHTSGFYSATPNYFSSALINGPITAPSSASSGGNGIYAYGTAAIYPSNSYNATNYYVDISFSSSIGSLPPTCNNVSGLWTQVNTALVIQASNLLANCSSPNGYTLALTGVSSPTNGSVSVNGSTVTFTPATNFTGQASFTFSVSDGHGGTASATASLTVVGQGTGSGSSLFSLSNTPTNPSWNDPNPVEVGVKFYAATAGKITGIQFYKGSQNTGTHTAHLWDSAGNLLASATFTNETASGWQSVTFASPVSITAGTIYVASYFTNGFYAVDANFFSSALTNGPLTAPDSASSSGNGVYLYGSTSAFPTNSFNAGNYWVDVSFQ